LGGSRDSRIFLWEEECVLRKFREDILEPFADAANIKLVDYYAKKGHRPLDPAESYEYDEADDIIYEIAKGFRKKKSVSKTFECLYQCYNEKETQEFLTRITPSGEIKIPERNSVLRYKRQAVKLIHAAVENDTKKLKRQEIIEALKREYERASKDKKHPSKIRNIPNLLFETANEDIAEGLFKDASQTIVSIARAFKWKSGLESSLSSRLESLSHNDYIAFVKELTREIRSIQKVIAHFDSTDQYQRVDHFTVFLSGSLKDMGTSLLQLEKWDDATSVLKEALNLKPNDSNLIALLGRVNLKLENIEALENQISLLSAEDEFVKGKLAETGELKAQGKHAEAINCLKDALIVPKLKNGEEFLKRGNLNEAIECFEFVHILDEENGSIIKVLAKLYLDSKQHIKAADLLEKSVNFIPELSNLSMLNANSLIQELREKHMIGLDLNSGILK
jgi:tetratricopeptide (TPR) repeat protein